MLVEQGSVPLGALPITEFKDHLLLGTGFSAGSVQDPVLENYLRSSIAAIEARTGKVLIEKQYSWTLTAWREACRQALPLAPISTVDVVRLIDRLGVVTVVDAADYRLEVDTHRPVLWSSAGNLPPIATGGTVEIDFTAGFGAAWGTVPDDLALAVFLLAAHFYENRAGLGTDGGMPFDVSSLIQKYRNVRIFGGAGA